MFVESVERTGPWGYRALRYDYGNDDGNDDATSR